MREKQRLSTNRKRIESPFAKYNRLGQLSCALCNTPVKSELLWQTHVLGKQHRERVAELKGAKEAVQGPSTGTAPQPTKRRATDVESQDAKKAKASVGPQVQPSTSGSSANFEKSGKDAARAAPSKPGLGLLPDYEDEEEEEEEGGGEERKRTPRGA